MLLDLGHAVAAGEILEVVVALNLLLLRGDSPVATLLRCSLPNLYRDLYCVTEGGGGVPGSSLTDPSIAATLAFTVILLLITIDVDVIVFSNIYFLVFVSLSPRTN